MPNRKPSVKALYMRVDPNLYDVMRAMAFDRAGVGVATMGEDMIRMVVMAIADPTDPALATVKRQRALLTPVPERFPGYRESLGIVADVDVDAGSHLSPLPVEPQDTSLI